VCVPVQKSPAATDRDDVIRCSNVTRAVPPKRGEGSGGLRMKGGPG